MKAALLLTLAAGLLTAGCGGSGEPSSAETRPEQTRPADRPRDMALRDLGSLEEFRTVFNRDRGSPRLLLIFSPT